MSNKKQSSVDYLATQIMDNWNDITAGARNIDEFIEQAKEIEKQQIIDAWTDGNDSEIRGGKVMRRMREQYYNEEYGQ